MPKVPQYQLGQQQLRPLEGEQRITVPEGAFGGLMAEQMVKSGKEAKRTVDQVAKFSQVLSERVEDANLLKLENELAEEIRVGLYETPSKENQVLKKAGVSSFGADQNRTYGFTTLQGQDAMNWQKEYEKRFQKFADSRGEGLGSRGRAKWEAIKHRRLLDANNRMSAHAVKQLGVYEGEQFQAAIEASAADAVSYAGDTTGTSWPETFQAEMKSGVERINKWATLHGWSEDQREAKIDGYVSGIHEGVVDRLLAEDKPSLAEAYLKRGLRGQPGKTVADEILPGNLTKITATIRGETLKTRSLRLTEELVGGDVDSPILTMTQQEARKKIRDKLSGDDQVQLLDATLTRIDRVYSEQTQNALNAERSAWDKLVKVGNLDQLTVDERQLVMMSPTKLRNFLRLDPVASDTEAWGEISELITLANGGNVKAASRLRDLNLSKDYGGRLTKTHMDQATKAIRSWGTGKPTPLVGTYTSQVTNVLNSMLGKSSKAKWSSSDKKFGIWFNHEMNIWGADFQDRNGSWPSTKEIDAKLFSLSEQITVEREGVFKLNKVRELDDIPLKSVKDIQTLLKEASPEDHYDPTASEIIHTYSYLEDSSHSDSQKRTYIQNRLKDKRERGRIFEAKSLLKDENK